MHQDHHQKLYETVRKLIPPPNPIINKHVSQDVLPQIIPPTQYHYQDLDSDQADDFREQQNTLANAYSKKAKIFDKWPSRVTCRNNIKYFASNFLDRSCIDNLSYVGQRVKDTLQFNSSIECGNLLAVFKVGGEQYDLVMHNDINSGGYTQWFNFLVSNGSFKGTVKFNIVNFYKKDSLFKHGMKPLSKSLVFDKNWKRSCHGVEYYPSDIRMEGRKSKYYKVLTFRYSFLFEGDSVQFCSCLPYSYQDLNAFIKTISSPKVRVKYLGATPLKKIVTLLQIYSESEDRNKKAIVVMGRQHAGETPSSFVLQSIIEELLSATQENEFLLAKYNFYIFPMVNVDGVSLGNYRCNFFGFDLNRCWQVEQSKRHPQIGFVKNEIKRIMKKEAIELILDVHGHSNKMNSFFYGNTFGRNNMFFPYVASKIEDFIDFGESSFNDEEYEKSNTARVVLGNLIRETGAAYTYEVSLFGGVRNGKKIAFNAEHYQQLGKSLVLAMYKSNVELYKEEKFQKESPFLKEIRKELRRYEGKVKNRNSGGSDDEAKKTSQIEEKAKIAPLRTQLKKHASEQIQFKQWQLPIQEQSTQTALPFLLEEYKLYRAIMQQPLSQKKTQEEGGSVKKKASFYIRQTQGIDQINRKFELMSKLRIFGSTFTPQSTILQYSNRINHTTTKQTQTNLTLNAPKQDRTTRFSLKSPDNPTLGRSFIGKHIGESRSRRKQKIYKSTSHRVVQGQVNFQGLIKYNRVSFV